MFAICALSSSHAYVDAVSFKVLAALDVHTAKWVVDKCFKGDLVDERTVLLVVRCSIESLLGLDA